MRETPCGACHGGRDSTCFSCGGKRYHHRFGRYGMETNPCAPCGGRGRIPCQMCQGRGVQRVANVPGQPSSSSQKPREGFDPNDLSGRWEGQNGGYDLKKSGSRYEVTEVGILGATGKGEAVREGDTLHLVVNNMLLGRLALQLHIEGDSLRGQLNIMGMPMPLVLQRVSGPSAPAKTAPTKTAQKARPIRREESPEKARRIPARKVPVARLIPKGAPPELEERFDRSMEAAAVASESGAHEEAQGHYVEALEAAMESPQPDDDLEALTGLLFIARHIELSEETLGRCSRCLDGLVKGGHGGDLVAAALSLLVDSAKGRFEPEQMRVLGSHGLTLLRGELHPNNQALVAWAAGSLWLRLDEPEPARQALELVDRPAVPAEMTENLEKLEKILASIP